MNRPGCRGLCPDFPSKVEICSDCNGTGREQIPCDVDDIHCEFCAGVGYFWQQEPQESTLLADRPRKCARVPRFGDGA